MNRFQVKVIVHARQPGYVVAMRLSIYRNNNSESRLILRAPLLINQLQN